MKKHWYKSLYENYAESYEKEPFLFGTSGEVDFIEQEIDSDKSTKILDVGCGIGRHSIELARRGYEVTGIDLSESMIKKAQREAANEGVTVDFQVMDAREMTFENEFDLALIICEGAFSLMENEDMDFLILQNISRALNEQAKIILTTPNAFFPIAHPNKEDEDSRYDIIQQREYFSLDFKDDSGTKKYLECNQRYYTPGEIRFMLKQLDFKTIDFYSCKLGKFSRKNKLTKDDFEMLIIAER